MNKTDSYIKRPLLLGLVFYIVGLIGGSLHYNIMQLSLFFLSITIVVATLIIYNRNIYIAVYLLIGCLGFVNITAHPVIKDERIILKANKEKTNLIGKVVEVKEYEYENQYIVKPIKASPISQKIKISAKKDFILAKEGDTISVKGSIEPLSGPRNPGGFDERTYLMIRGVAGKIRAESLEIEGQRSRELLVNRIQGYYGKMFEQIMPWEEAQIMKAMLLGDKLLLSKETKDLYRDIGIAHVLAISGLHISVIAGFAWWLLNALGLNTKLQALLVLGFLWFYGAFTGFSVSITRAIIMMSVLIVASLIEETPDTITSLSFAALILLIDNSLYLWDIGFQLSFVATASIILLSPFFQRIFIIPQKLRSYMAPTLAATTGIAPLVAYHYYVISPISLITNLLLVPLIIGVVIIGFMGMIIFPISTILTRLLISFAYYLLRLVEVLGKLALKIPFSTLIVGKPQLIELIIYIGIIGLILYYLYLDLEKRKKYRFYIVSANIVLLLGLFVNQVIPGDLEVTFLDVGQGDSIVIRSPDHRTFVIDGGDKGNGQKIERFLKYKGIRKIDALILSHAHQDHMLGLGELATLYHIDRLFVSQLPLEDTHFKNFYDIMEKENIPIITLKEGDTIKDKNIVMECIFPFKDITHLEGNDSSLILVLRHGMVSYYFTGDIEEEYEKKIAGHIDKNLVNILKVAHHGSKSSSSQEFIEAVDPDLAVISCGRNNIYNNPAKEVVERYQANKVAIEITKDRGAIMTYSNKKTVKVELMEDMELLWR